ncbi:MAG: XisI protein [Blastocatellia bacterium]
MDKVVFYRQLLKQILQEYIDLVRRQPTPGVESELIIDEIRDNFMWVKIGWTEDERVDGAVFFARIRHGKILIEEDWTEDGIATQLVRSGVPAEDIVLAFHEPEFQTYTDIIAA